MKRFFLLVLLAMMSCGPQEQKFSSKDATTLEQNSVNVDAQYLEDMLIHHLQETSEQNYYESQRTAQILFVNFNGATVKKGYEASESSIICTDEANISAHPISQKALTEIDYKLNSYFKDINVNVAVVYDEPVTGPYTTVHVTNNNKSTGCPSRGLTNGLAALDMYNLNKQDVAFVFTNGQANSTIVANLIAHIAGHTFGLQDSADKEDLMHPSISTDMTGFTAAKSARDNKVQDSPAMLRENVGRSNYTPLHVNSNLEGIEELPAEMKDLVGLEAIASLAKLLKDLNQNDIGDASDLLKQLNQTLVGEDGQVTIQGFNELMTILGIVSGAFINSDDFTNLKDVLIPSLIVTLGGIPGLTEIAGYLAIASLVLDLVAILTNTKNDTVKDLPMLNGLPELTSLLGIDEITDKAELAAQSKKHFAVVNLNFTAKTQQVLISFVKIAYSQRYRQLDLQVR